MQRATVLAREHAAREDALNKRNQDAKAKLAALREKRAALADSDETRELYGVDEAIKTHEAALAGIAKESEELRAERQQTIYRMFPEPFDVGRLERGVGVKLVEIRHPDASLASWVAVFRAGSGRQALAFLGPSVVPGSMTYQFLRAIGEPVPDGPEAVVSVNLARLTGRECLADVLFVEGGSYSGTGEIVALYPAGGKSPHPKGWGEF